MLKKAVNFARDSISFYAKKNEETSVVKLLTTVTNIASTVVKRIDTILEDGGIYGAAKKVKESSMSIYEQAKTKAEPLTEKGQEYLDKGKLKAGEIRSRYADHASGFDALNTEPPPEDLKGFALHSWKDKALKERLKREEEGGLGYKLKRATHGLSGLAGEAVTELKGIKDSVLEGTSTSSILKRAESLFKGEPVGPQTGEGTTLAGGTATELKGTDTSSVLERTESLFKGEPAEQQTSERTTLAGETTAELKGTDTSSILKLVESLFKREPVEQQTGEGTSTTHGLTGLAEGTDTELKGTALADEATTELKGIKDSVFKLVESLFKGEPAEQQTSEGTSLAGETDKGTSTSTTLKRAESLFKREPAGQQPKKGTSTTHGLAGEAAAELKGTDDSSILKRVEGLFKREPVEQQTSKGTTLAGEAATELKGTDTSSILKLVESLFKSEPVGSQSGEGTSTIHGLVGEAATELKGIKDSVLEREESLFRREPVGPQNGEGTSTVQNRSFSDPSYEEEYSSETIKGSKPTREDTEEEGGFFRFLKKIYNDDKEEEEEVKESKQSKKKPKKKRLVRRSLISSASGLKKATEVSQAGVFGALSELGGMTGKGLLTVFPEIGTLWKGVKGLYKVTRLTNRIFTGTVKAVAGFAHGIAKKLIPGYSLLAKGISAITSLPGKLLGGMKNIASGMFGSLREKASGLTSSASEKLSSMKNSATSWLGGLVTRRKDNVDETKQRVKDRAKADKDPSWLTKILGNFGKILTGLSVGWGLLRKYGMEGVKWLGGKLWGGVKWLGKSMWKGLKWTSGKLWKGLKWMGGKVVKAPITAAKWLKNKLFAAITGLGKGLATGLSKVTGKVAGLGKTILGGVKSAVMGPLKLLGKGLGINTETLNKGKEAIKNGLGKAKGWMGKHLSKGKNLMKLVGQGGKSAALSIGKKVSIRGLMRAGTLLLGPLGVAINVGLLLYDAYKIYKWIQKKSKPENITEKLTLLRFMSYGFGHDQKDNFQNLIQIEEYFAQYVVIDKENKDASLMGVPEEVIDKVAETLKLNRDNKDEEKLLMDWINKRFVNGYLNFITAMYHADQSFEATKIGKLDEFSEKVFLDFFKNYSMPSEVFNLVNIPSLDKEESTVTLDTFNSYLREIYDELKKKYKDSDTVKPKDSKTKTSKEQPEDKPKGEVNLGDKTDDKVKGKDPKILDDESEDPGERNKPNTSNPAPNKPGGMPMADGELMEGDDSLTGIKLASNVREDTITRLDPNVKNLFTGMAMEYHSKTGKELGVNFGKRSSVEQARLYRNNPSKAAPPGRSLHEYGLAVDVNSADVRELHELGLLKKYGFATAIGKETWHLEPIGVSTDPQRAKRDLKFRRDSVIASPGRGGDGFGLVYKGDKYTRNISYQQELYDAGKSNAIPVKDKDAVTTSVSQEDKGTGLDDLWNKQRNLSGSNVSNQPTEFGQKPVTSRGTSLNPSNIGDKVPKHNGEVSTRSGPVSLENIASSSTTSPTVDTSSYKTESTQSTRPLRTGADAPAPLTTSRNNRPVDRGVNNTPVMSSAVIEQTLKSQLKLTESMLSVLTNIDNKLNIEALVEGLSSAVQGNRAPPPSNTKTIPKSAVSVSRRSMV